MFFTIALVGLTASEKEEKYYLVCEYKMVFPINDQERTWEQVWLPFTATKANKEGKKHVAPGELDFRTVTEKNRIAGFPSNSKPS